MKPCAICTHPERALLDGLLREGLGPRAITRRIGATTRKGLTRHRDVCLKTSTEHERKSA